MKIDAGTLLLLAFGYWLYTSGHYKDVLQWLGINQQGGGQQPVTTGCTAEDVARWSSPPPIGTGLPRCVAEKFCAEFGRLPRSLEELVTWGNQRGLRRPDGVWVC